MIRKKTVLGAASAGALALVATVGPAVAAGDLTASATYSCLSGAIQAPVTLDVVPPSKTSLVAGEKITSAATATVKLGVVATQFLKNQGWVTFDGTVKAPTPATVIGMNLTVPNTPVGNTDAGTTTTATATGTAVFRYSRAGTFNVAAGNFNALLQGFDGSSQPIGTGPTPVDCVAPAPGTVELDDSTPAPLAMTITKDASTTAVTAAFARAKHQALGTATVKGKNFGLIGTGKVNFTLKKGLRAIAVAKGVKLNAKGVAKHVFKNVTRAGKYTIVASYGGNGGLKKSSGKKAFTVR